MYQVRNNQTVWDVASAVFGTISMAFAICQANNLCLTDDLVPGTMLVMPEGDVNRSVVDYYAQKKINPATNG